MHFENIGHQNDLVEDIALWERKDQIIQYFGLTIPKVSFSSKARS